MGDGSWIRDSVSAPARRAAVSCPMTLALIPPELHLAFRISAYPFRVALPEWRNLVDATDSKSVSREGVWVRVPPRVHCVPSRHRRSMSRIGSHR